MQRINTILILSVLLFSTEVAFSQCETYLQKADAFFAQKNYADAKKQYQAYKICDSSPNAYVDKQIAACGNSEDTEKKLYYNENWQGCSQYQAKYYRLAKFDASGKPVGRVLDYYITGELQSEIDGAIYIDEVNDRNSKFTGNTIGYHKNGMISHEKKYDNQGNILSSKSYKEDGTLIVPRTKPSIGIGYFSGYKSDQAKNDITSAFVKDGRFIVTQIQNSGYGSNQQTTSDVDYIISGTSECVQRERTEYINVPATKYSNAVRIPNTIPEIVNVVITLTDANTGQIVVNSNYNLKNLNRISGNIFPVKFTVNNVDDGKIGIVNTSGGTYFIDDIFNVYEEYGNGGKNFLGKLKIGKTNNDCKITEGKKEINSRFRAGAKLVVTR